MKEVLIVLGQNFAPHKAPQSSSVGHLRQSPESRLGAIAAFQLAMKTEVDAIIFTGGHTGSKENLSEAAGMAATFHQRLAHRGKVFGGEVHTEDQSLDTQDNADGVRQIITSFGLIDADISIRLVAIRSHLERAMKILKNRGVETSGVAVEDVVRTISKRHAHVVDAYESSWRSHFRTLTEFILRAEMAIDPRGAIPHAVAQIIRKRHQNL